METLTYENLIDAGACDEAERFARAYPDGLPLNADAIEAAIARFSNGLDFIFGRLPREISNELHRAIEMRVDNARQRIVAQVLADAAPEIMMALPKDRRDNPHADDHRTYDQRLADLPRQFASAIGAGEGITPEDIRRAAEMLIAEREDPTLADALLMVARAPTAHRPRAGARHFIEQLQGVNLTHMEAAELHVAIEARVRPLRGGDYPPARTGTGAVHFSPQFSARELAILNDMIVERDRPQAPLTGS
jgi:hypothetical protein